MGEHVCVCVSERHEKLEIMKIKILVVYISLTNMKHESEWFTH